MNRPKFLDEEIYEAFDDSFIEDSDEDSATDPFEFDDVVDVENESEIDPLWIENLLEAAESDEPHDAVNYTEKRDIEWIRGSFSFQEIPFKSTQNAASNSDRAYNQKSPLEYFKTYFTDELFENFAIKTNMYAQQQNQVSFKPTSASEIKVLFGLHMMMGWIKLPRVSMYWSRLLNLTTFKESMTSERFFQLRTNLHVVNNLDKPADNNDKFYKVRPVLEAVRSRILQFEVEETVSVDEQMIPMKNRLTMKQYMKDKPNKWGCKVYVLCGKSGMPYDFFIYQGSTTELSSENQRKFGFCASVVLHLAERLNESGHKMFYDNYFSSYQLLEVLKEKGVNAGGTIRVDRFAKPPLLSDKEMLKEGRGHSDSVVSKDGKVVVVKWQDNKCVHLASNFVGIGGSDTAKRWDKKQKKHVEVSRPEIVSRYNGGMGGVDLLDQLLSYYRVFIRSKKWALRVIFHFVDFAICSSWLEYRNDQRKANVPKEKINDLLKFRMELTYSIIKVGNPTCQSQRGRPKATKPEVVSRRNPSASHEVRPSKDIRLDKFDHVPHHDHKTKPTRCKNNIKCSGRTFLYCKKCNVHLCINKTKNCFAEFHSNN